MLIYKTTKETVALIKEQFQTKSVTIHTKEPIIHKLSHQHLHISFYEIQLKKAILNSVSFEEMMKKPFPIVLHNFIEANYFEFDKK